MAGSGASHLNTSKLNLGLLRDYYRRLFLECIDKSSGTKALVWDDGLTGPFGLIAEASLLKEQHEVERMFRLESSGLPASNVQNIIFIVRPRLSLMETVAQCLLNFTVSSCRSTGIYNCSYIGHLSSSSYTITKRLYISTQCPLRSLSDRFLDSNNRYIGDFLNTAFVSFEVFGYPGPKSMNIFKTRYSDKYLANDSVNVTYTQGYGPHGSVYIKFINTELIKELQDFTLISITEQAIQPFDSPFKPTAYLVEMETITSIDQLVEKLQEVKDYDEMPRLLQATNHLDSEWQNYAFWSNNKSYSRNLIHEEKGKFQLFLICWQSGQGNDPHKHLGSRRFFKVLYGNIVETFYLEADSDLSQKTDKEYETGDSCDMGENLLLIT
ncbi:hypothetical protein Btru_008991 [Bulinus truncatus]|nr:hypothetical protein Btru_008991 [Bulinus truncatus]